MIEWRIGMADLEGPLDHVRLPPEIDGVIGPLREQLARTLGEIDEGEVLTITFRVEKDRTLSVHLDGDPLVVNLARDALDRDARAVAPLS